MRVARVAVLAAVLIVATAAPGIAGLLADTVEPPSDTIGRGGRVVDALDPGPNAVVLGRFTATGDAYAGLRFHVPEEGFFTTFTVGVASVPSMVRFIGLDVRTGGGHGGGSDGPMVGAAGAGASAPGPSAGTGGTLLRPGDYYAVSAAPGGAMTVELRGPRSARVVGRVHGPARGFTDVDFTRSGGMVVAGPGVDRRSVHGSVTVAAAHTLFASFGPCPGARSEVTAPQASSGYWGPRGVTYGSPGQWIFTLHHDTNTVTPDGPLACRNSLIVLDVTLPGPVPAE